RLRFGVQPPGPAPVVAGESAGLEMPVPDTGVARGGRGRGAGAGGEAKAQQAGEEKPSHAGEPKLAAAAKPGPALQLSLRVGGCGASAGGKGEAGMPSSASSRASSGVVSPQIARSSASPACILRASSAKRSPT